MHEGELPTQVELWITDITEEAPKEATSALTVSWTLMFRP